MKIKPVHIIQKEVLDISFPDFESARSWEVNERQRLMQAVEKVIERTFDEYDALDQHIVIDRMELDLGIFKPADFHRELPERLYTELKKTLSGQRQPAANAEQAGAEDIQPGNGFNSAGKERVYSGMQGRLESLLFFLGNGYLPWWASGLADWDEPWLLKLTATGWTKLTQLLTRKGDYPGLRLASQFSNGFLAELVKGLGVVFHTMDAWLWLVQLVEKGNEDFPDHMPAQLRMVRRNYWHQWINHATGKAAVPGLSQLLGGNRYAGSVVRQLLQSKPVPGTLLSFLDHVPAFWKKELEEMKTAAEEDQKSSLPEQNEAGNLLTGTPLAPTNATAGKDSQSVDASSKGISGEPQEIPALKKTDPALPPPAMPFLMPVNTLLNSKRLSDEQKKILFIKEAGLILLHPFLPELFNNCGWMKKQQFPDAPAQTMAVYALHYLATGQQEAPEHRLLLPKLLCGMPWEKPLEPVEPLSDKEKAACNELLSAVVGHWKVLRNTSPDGLRDAYLQRTGKLEPDATGWRLEVEHKAQDVLLSRLPWGLSIIKYSWMAGMLSVTWK